MSKKNILNPKNWVSTPEEKERAEARRIVDEKEQAIELEKINFKYGHIDQHAYDKNMATHNGEDYIRVVGMELDEGQPGKGFFELDFNDNFVEYLAKSGYEGLEPDQIVDSWFSDLCKNIVLSDLEDEEGVSKSVLTDSKEGLIIKKLKTGDKTSEYY
mgnify:FL=1|jgi:hypothetical protein|tara:strand:+ start:228 stop:701 length:474 start_codon:yes stop_codon:yes gene_type:complete